MQLTANPAQADDFTLNYEVIRSEKITKSQCGGLSLKQLYKNSTINEHSLGAKTDKGQIQRSGEHATP